MAITCLQGFAFYLEAEDLLSTNKATEAENEKAIKAAMVLRNQAVSSWLQAAIGVRSDKHREKAWSNAVALLRAMGNFDQANEVENVSRQHPAKKL